MPYLPNIFERQGGVERGYDIYSRLLIDRIVFLQGQIQDESADAVVAQLLFLDSQNPEKEISLYINSPGGSVTAGLAIYDTIRYIRPKVQTFCLGQAGFNGSCYPECWRKGFALYFAFQPRNVCTSPGVALKGNRVTWRSRLKK